MVEGSVEVVGKCVGVRGDSDVVYSKVNIIDILDMDIAPCLFDLFFRNN